MAFNFSERFSLRAYASYGYSTAVFRQVHLFVGLVMPTLWFGVYGVGLAAVAGIGITSQDGTGFAVGALASPLRLRFGKPRRIGSRRVHCIAGCLNAARIGKRILDAGGTSRSP